MGLISIRLMNAPTNHVPANPQHVHTPISDDKRLPSELFMHWRGPSIGPPWGGVSIVILPVGRWSLFFFACLVSSSPDLEVLLNIPRRWLRDASQLGRGLWPVVHPTQSSLHSLCSSDACGGHGGMHMGDLEAINGLVVKEHGSFYILSLFNTFNVWVLLCVHCVHVMVELP